SDGAGAKASDAKPSDGAGTKASDGQPSDAKPDGKQSSVKPAAGDATAEARKALTRKSLTPRKYTPGRKSQAAVKAEAKASGAMPWDGPVDAGAAPSGQSKKTKTKKGSR